jgi:hypothetical protein
MTGIPEDARARIAYAEAVQAVVDHGFHLVRDVAAEHAPGDLIRDARKLRYNAVYPVDMAVIIELMNGTSWEAVAAELKLPVAETQARYAETLNVWLIGDGSSDKAARLSAVTLDQWSERHDIDPWVEKVEQPVSKVLAGG